MAGGKYNEVLEITKPVTVRGRCAALVEISGTGAGPAIDVWDGEKPRVARGSGAVLGCGVHVTGSGRGVEVTATRPVAFDDLWVTGVRAMGLVASGSKATVTVRAAVVAQPALEGRKPTQGESCTANPWRYWPACASG